MAVQARTAGKPARNGGEVESNSDQAGKRGAGRRPKTFDGLELSLRDTRERLEQLEKQKAEREKRLAEILGRRMIAESVHADSAVSAKAVEWVRRQLESDSSLAGDEQEIVEDFLSSLQSKGAAHG